MAPRRCTTAGHLALVAVGLWLACATDAADVADAADAADADADGSADAAPAADMADTGPRFLGQRPEATWTSGVPLSSFRNCYLEPLREGLGCTRLGPPLEGPEFGLNEFGQETTGKRRCLERLRMAGGDSFVFAVGRCELWQCGSRDALRACAGFPAEVTPGLSLWNLWSHRFLGQRADGAIWAGEPFVTEQTKFQVVNNTDGTVSLRTGSGRFLALRGDRSVGTLPRPEGDARLLLIAQPDGTVSVQSAEGRWLRANPEGLVEAGTSREGDPARFWPVNEQAAAQAAKKEVVRRYTQLSNGTCASAGLAPINDKAGCEAAAAWLGLADTTADITDKESRPEGCYYWSGKHLWLGTNPASRGKGAETSEPGVTRHPICVHEGLLTQANASVYSQLCSFQEPSGGLRGGEPRSPVFVTLWEWNFADVARECEERLGPAGIDGVQISPVLEHMLGHSWWVKYQTVSLGLQSRAGGPKELQHMVATCRKAGVQVIVDVVLNQMALCSGDGLTMPCTGWNGTRYGNRVTEGARGWDAAWPSYFHHLQQNIMWNCGYGPPTFTCPPEYMPDCQPCDMYGLPDWDTGLPVVRDMLARHLEELNDMGVTMLRIDASMHISPEDLAAIVNRAPWDMVVQEWFGSRIPTEERTRLVGLYRDASYRWTVASALAVSDISRFETALSITRGDANLRPEMAMYLLTFHDGRTKTADQPTPTYKNGMEYNQQQKFMLAWPAGISVMLWGGYGYADLDDGPPGCDPGQSRCAVTSVFAARPGGGCMSTPFESPLPPTVANRRGWICEHRWEGVEGLVGFRKACRHLPVSQTWRPSSAFLGRRTQRGRIAFQLGSDCFVALVRGTNNQKKQRWGPLGPWQLAGLVLDLPAGRYCDVSSLSDVRNWDRRSCPREVTIGSNGKVLNGTVPDGNLLAIHVKARFQD